MAVLKTILHKKNSSGSYDDVYLRTRADNVLLTDNSTLLSAKLSSMDTTIAGKAASNHSHTGYASSSHTHTATDITSGTLPLTRGGTGVTSISALKTALGIGSGGGLQYLTVSSNGYKTCTPNNYTTLWSTTNTIKFYILTVDGSATYQDGTYDLVEDSNCFTKYILLPAGETYYDTGSSYSADLESTGRSDGITLHCLQNMIALYVQGGIDQCSFSVTGFAIY